MSSEAFGESTTLIPALAARHGIEPQDIVHIVEDILGDLHRIAIQSESGPIGAIYASKWLLSEQAQYHLAGILIEYLAFNELEDTGEIVTDLFRFVSPERDRWNEITGQWVGLRHPTRKAMDEQRRRAPNGGDTNE